MTTIINDLHLGTVRRTGTTPASQASLQVFIYEQLDRLLETAEDDLVILGDLFDGFTVDPNHVILAFTALADYLKEPGNSLTLVCGNHDHNPRAGKTSSWHLLVHFLKAQFKSKVVVVDYTDGLTKVGNEWYVPHMPNQALFDLELEKALAVERPTWLLLHANCINNFAAHSDHSLNVSEAQVDALLAAGWSLLFAHEHQARRLRNGRVVIPGNQIPTSIADCLGCNDKFYTRIEGGVVETAPWLHVADHFQEIDWRELNGQTTSFIRVTGEATAEDAAAVVDAVAKFRQRSGAYAVSNAVKVEGVAGFDQLAEMSLEGISQFNVMEALLAELSEAEGAKVKELSV